jgi:uncharacterized protein YycO
MKIKFTASWLPLSPLIRLWTWSKCSHCEFEFSDGMIIVPAMEAGRVIATKNRKYTWEHVYNIPVTPEQEQLIRQWAEDQIGKPYDYTALAPLNVLIPRTKKQWKNDDIWMCSEFCAYALELVGFEYFSNEHKKITPGDLMKAFTKDKRI